MDQVLYVLIGLSYVIGPLSLGAMIVVAWKLFQDQRRNERERS